MLRKAGGSSARISGLLVWKGTARPGTRYAAMFAGKVSRHGASRPKSCSYGSASDLAAIDMQDVAVRVLEPCRFEVSGKMDVAFAAEAGQVVMLEAAVRPLQGANDGFHFANDAPGRGGRLVG